MGNLAIVVGWLATGARKRELARTNLLWSYQDLVDA
ncbi:hypothetical protein HDE80_004529 [Rhodanobacter sp. A1T4]|nr:hypothetical protein [Rhodanobacter sp. A1T4]